jgi:uncharacterized protein YjbI with pentapeptide repeats
MTTNAEDRSTWPRNGQIIRRDELLRLIEDNGGPKGLDLRGTVFVGDEPSDNPRENPIDLSREALGPLARAYRQGSKRSGPRWLSWTGSINLAGAQLQGADLEGAQLQAAYFAYAQLQGARLQSAQLQGAYFTYAQLQGTSLVAAQLQGARLVDAQLQGAYFAYAQLQGARLVDAQLQGARLQSAQLQGAVLWYAQLQGADLEGAQLQGADLWGAQLQGADLSRAQLRGARLQSVQLQGVDMYDVGSLDGARWYAAHLDQTRIRREALGKAIGDELEAHDSKGAEDYHRAKEAYLLVKNNFNQIGRYEDASWAYVKEQQMEKMAHYWEWRSNGWRVWRAWGAFWRWQRNWGYELATGYGERPWNPVVGGVLIIMGFAGGFCATRAVANLWDALIYSLATFATFNLADTGPTGRGADVASSVEALLGIAILALVIFTLGKKMSRG